MLTNLLIKESAGQAKTERADRPERSQGKRQRELAATCLLTCSTKSQQPKQRQRELTGQRASSQGSTKSQQPRQRQRELTGASLLNRSRLKYNSPIHQEARERELR